MPQALMYRQVAGFPIWPFCAKHDRFVQPISMLAADGTKRAVCPYCADEELQCGVAESAVKETKATEWRAREIYYGRGVSVTYFCPYDKCTYSTNEHLSLRQHVEFIHREKMSSKDACKVSDCKNLGVEFCSRCERAFCFDHLDIHSLCIECGEMVGWSGL